MPAIEINIILFAVLVVVFAAFGFAAAGRQRSAKDYFHDAGLRRNVVSLTATNITLGTGLVYLVTGAQHNGVLMLLIPLMVFLGYYLQALFLEKATSARVRRGKNILASLDDQIREATGAASPFARTVSGSLVLVYVLVLAFEIFASSKVVAPFLFRTPSVTAEIALSVVIFCITILYTILGGVRAIFNVDIVQVPLICIFLPVLVWTSIPDGLKPSEVAERLSANVKLDAAVLVGVAIACMNAITTQFYSLINWGAVSHVELANQQRLLKWVGATTAVVLTVFVAVGLLHPVQHGGQVWQEIAREYSQLVLGSNLRAYVLSGILLCGMASVLLTTTDAVVMTCIMFWYDNVARGDSTSGKEDILELKRIRRIGATTFTVCFAILMAINYWQPDPFYLLLSMAGGVVVFAPMIATAGYLSSRGDALGVFSRWVVYLYFVVFILSGVADTVLLSRKSPWVSYVGLVAFALSSIISAGVVIHARASKHEVSTP